MKILKKLGLVFNSCVLGIIMLVSKVYAISIHDIPSASDYGVQLEPEPSMSTNIASTIIVPIILLIGIVVFLVKSTSSVLKKVIVSVGVVGAYIVFRIIMNSIVD